MLILTEIKVTMVQSLSTTDSERIQNAFKAYLKGKMEYFEQE